MTGVGTGGAIVLIHLERGRSDGRGEGEGDWGFEAGVWGASKQHRACPSGRGSGLRVLGRVPGSATSHRTSPGKASRMDGSDDVRGTGLGEGLPQLPGFLPATQLFPPPLFSAIEAYFP